jgi:hypothetical protein
MEAIGRLVMNFQPDQRRAPVPRQGKTTKQACYTTGKIRQYSENRPTKSHGLGQISNITKE